MFLKCKVCGVHIYPLMEPPMLACPGDAEALCTDCWVWATTYMINIKSRDAVVCGMERMAKKLGV